MARQMYLPSDPEYLLQYMDDLDSDSSGEEFDGYIDDDDIDEEAMRRCDGLQEDLHLGTEVNSMTDERNEDWMYSGAAMNF